MKHVDLYKDLVVIGGGPAGLAAALAAHQEGISDILLLERNSELGGILQQCIHNGFGIHLFDEELTGPEYAEVFINRLEENGIEYECETMVLQVDNSRRIVCINPQRGLRFIQAKAVILAMGCRERTRGAINIPGTRPAGVFTAGTAQQLTNLKGFMPGQNIVILGSGDIGLIMARRFTLEGAKVGAVIERLPYPGGLTRNVVQCLHDFNIPLYLSHTVVEIHGQNRVTGVTVAPVDEEGRPKNEEQFYMPCDTLVLSVGLIPENELSRGAGVEIDPVTDGPVVDQYRQTNVPGIFACGNVLHVHDLVDYVTRESELAGRSAARFIQGRQTLPTCRVPVRAGEGVRYVVPHFMGCNEPITLYLRVREPGKSVTLQVAGGVVRKRQRIVRPSEMILIRLGEKDVKALADHGEVRVDLLKE